MKPQGITAKHKPKDWIALSSFAMTKSVPDEIDYRQHLIPYKGSDGADIPWGVYGYRSVDVAAHLACIRAQEKEKIKVDLAVWYRIDDFAATTSKLPKTIAECNGYLHVGRISASLRKKMWSEMMDLLGEERSAAQMGKYRAMPCSEFLLREPGIVRKWFALQVTLHMIVHPVSPSFAATDEVVAIGSFKADADRIMAVEARGWPQIRVEI